MPGLAPKAPAGTEGHEHFDKTQETPGMALSAGRIAWPTQTASGFGAIMLRLGRYNDALLLALNARCISRTSAPNKVPAATGRCPLP
jgi:hypothetical protein